jgi:lipoyl synthase
MQKLSSKFPPWLKRRIPASGESGKVSRVLRDLRLNTVCMSAHCPNMGECFGSGTATFLILGGVCTRSCGFCSVPGGSPGPVDAAEADSVAQAARSLGLKHVVITSVTRDDLKDGGAGHFSACITKVRELSPAATIEVLVPDFLGSMDALTLVLDAMPDVLNHNIETVPALYARVRPQADYRRSLAVLRAAAQRGRYLVKSGIMVGLGETPEEVVALFSDLASAGVSALTIGQYLRPSPDHLPIVEYIHPDRFRYYEEMAYAAGINKVSSGPFVRSSYHAGEMVQ